MIRVLALVLACALGAYPKTLAPAPLDPKPSMDVPEPVKEPTKFRRSLPRYIKRISKKISPQRAEFLAYHISKAADHFEIDEYLFAAILRRESNFKSGALHVNHHPDGSISYDYGLGQVNSRVWVKRWNLDPARLQHDDVYNIWVSARILSLYKKQYEAIEPGWWWSRYNSGTPKHRMKYEKLVLPYLERLPEPTMQYIASAD